MKGILLINLGSTESPTPEAVKPFLEEFLMDEYVLDFPYWLRSLIVRGIILKTRPAKAAEAYKKIWWEEGSPITVISHSLYDKLKQAVSMPIALAMRYGKPSIYEGIKELSEKGVKEIFLIGLYPQYAMSTTGTVEALAQKVVRENFPEINLYFMRPFYDHPGFISNVSAKIKRELKGFEYDRLLLSYHSLPLRHLRKTDKTGKHKKVKFIEEEYCCSPGSEEAQYCYRTQCMETTRAIVEKLAIPEGKYTTVFQSRLGIDKWITPFTADTLKQMAKEGVKRIAVVAPSFVADCVETLEELDIEGRQYFLDNGGEEFRLIPCLNDDDAWVGTLADVAKKWQEN